MYLSEIEYKGKKKGNCCMEKKTRGCREGNTTRRTVIVHTNSKKKLNPLKVITHVNIDTSSHQLSLTPSHQAPQGVAAGEAH